MVQNRHAGEQKSHWDKTNKGKYHLKLMYVFYLSLTVPVRLLLSSMVALHQWLAAKGLFAGVSIYLQVFQI